MFSTLKSMINKVWDFIPWPRTRQEQNSLTSYKKDLEQEIKKTERKVRTRLTDEQRAQRALAKQERNKQRVNTTSSSETKRTQGRVQAFESRDKKIGGTGQKTEKRK